MREESNDFRFKPPPNTSHDQILILYKILGQCLYFSKICNTLGLSLLVLEQEASLWVYPNDLKISPKVMYIIYWNKEFDDKSTDILLVRVCHNDTF